MNCTDVRPLLHAHSDGELDLLRSVEVDRHVKSCAACARAENALRALRSAVKTSGLPYRAPDSLRDEVRRVVIGTKERPKERPRSFEWSGLLRWFALGATAIAAVVLVLLLGSDSAGERVASEVITAHVRSLMADHLTDVASSDQHTVKPWFSGKLDFAPNVKDLAAQGFPLAGGRLDFIDGRPVAALVYRRNKHVINVFIWPVGSVRAMKVKEKNLRGYSVVNRESNGLHYCLISDLNSAELKELADRLAE